MILICKDRKVIAYHADEQEYVIERYPQDCEVLKVDQAEFDEEGWPKYPEGKLTLNLRVTGSTEQRLRDLEIAISYLLGVGSP